MGENPSSTHAPVTYDNCSHVEGPFFHGTKSVLGVGAELAPGCASNFQRGRVLNHIYFSSLVETALYSLGQPVLLKP